MLHSLIALSSLLLCATGTAGDETTIIDVPGLGRLRCNILNGNLSECMGIRFASAPVGSNRFRPPQALPQYPQNDSGEINATTHGAACPQHTFDFTGIQSWEIDEDCLNLNVWAPVRQPGQAALPVFLWIHGGGGYNGAGWSYNLSRFAAKGVVAVTINYRLGALGWLPLEDIAQENPQAPGNGGVHGFLDQIAAMRWVGQHVSAFGGDPGQITIAGQSEGSISVCAHLHMPVSQGLFRRAILESGSCSNGPWGWSLDGEGPQKKAQAYLKNLGAANLTALRQTPLKALMASPFFDAFGPNVDGWFLRKDPSELPMLASDTEMIIGSNTMDSLAAPPYRNVSLVPNTSSAYAAFVRGYFGAAGLALYPLPAKAQPEDVHRAFLRLNADVCNTCPKVWLAQKMLAANNTVYVYNFGFNAKTPLQGLACHGCEISDTLGVPPNESAFIPSAFNPSYSRDLAAAMSGYWASFARNGTPQGSTDWPRYTGEMAEAHYLNITTSAGQPQLHVDSGLATAQCKFFQTFVDTNAAQKARFEQFCNDPVPPSSMRDGFFV